MFRRPLLLIGLIAILLTACTASPKPPPDGVRPIDPPLVLSDFTLTTQQNKPLHQSDLKGKLALMTFGYTHCPDICPVNLANFKQVKQTLGSKAALVNFVFVSVDGKRDTPEVVGAYMNLFDPAFIGLSGEDGAVRPMTGQFGVLYQIDGDPTSANYTVTHTASSFLVDQQGRLLRIYSYGVTPAVMADDMQQFLPS